MNKYSFFKQTLKIAYKLSPGFLVLGICMISWSTYQIYVQSAPAPVQIEQPKQQPDSIAVASVSMTAAKVSDAIKEPESEAAIETEYKPEMEVQTEIAKERLKETKAPTPTPTLIPKTSEILYPVRPSIGENIGNLRIPAINQVLPIVHGTDEEELSRGIGHFAGSVLPGENDNSVLSGHRDTVFRELGQLEITDQLIVETRAGTFTYEIREIKIVPSSDKTIITPSSSAVLTVTTCYPFNFIGSAPDRYILVADLVGRK